MPRGSSTRLLNITNTAIGFNRHWLRRAGHAHHAQPVFWISPAPLALDLLRLCPDSFPSLTQLHRVTLVPLGYEFSVSLALPSLDWYRTLQLVQVHHVKHLSCPYTYTTTAHTHSHLTRNHF